MIMDGNGRWALSRGKRRIEGHKRGADVAEQMVAFCSNNDIEYITLFAFSTENWQRSMDEVSYIMGLLRWFLRYKTRVFMKNSIRFRVIGERNTIPEALLKQIERTEKKTAHFRKHNLTLALSYGGRQEIVLAARAACEAVQKGKLIPDELTVDTFSPFLMASICIQS